MPNEAHATQEPRSERAAVMLTEREKKDLRFFADARGLTESDAIRDFTMTDISAGAAGMREKLGLAAA